MLHPLQNRSTRRTTTSLVTSPSSSTGFRHTSLHSLRSATCLRPVGHHPSQPLLPCPNSDPFPFPQFSLIGPHLPLSPVHSLPLSSLLEICSFCFIFSAVPPFTMAHSPTDKSRRHRTSGTAMMYLGLTMTYASVFQMLRGSVVVFTGILSIMMLNRKLWPCHWLGMLLVMGGAFVVGVRYTFSSISWLVLLLLKPLVIFLTGPQMHARD